MKKLILICCLIALSLVPAAVYAKIGVGVGTGKIKVEDKLKPGTIYELPSLTVFNTGDVTSEYEINVAYHEKQPELRPARSWFIFTPETFKLEPGTSQEVKIKLNLPVLTEPGNYFAYLEGHPFAKSVNGKTTVGIAAAAKLYFTIVPGNIFEGVYFKVVTFWKIYSPWPQRGIIALVVLIGIILIRKNFNIQIGFKKSDESHSVPKDE